MSWDFHLFVLDPAASAVTNTALPPANYLQAETKNTVPHVSITHTSFHLLRTFWDFPAYTAMKYREITVLFLPSPDILSWEVLVFSEDSLAISSNQCSLISNSGHLSNNPSDWFPFLSYLTHPFACLLSAIALSNTLEAHKTFPEACGIWETQAWYFPLWP